jgi:hypothetical protein
MSSNSMGCAIESLGTKLTLPDKDLSSENHQTSQRLSIYIYLHVGVKGIGRIQSEFAGVYDSRNRNNFAPDTMV